MWQPRGIEMHCATRLEIAIWKWSKDNKCCRLVHKIKTSKNVCSGDLIMLTIKETKGNKQAGDRESLTWPQAGNKIKPAVCTVFLGSSPTQLKIRLIYTPALYLPALSLESRRGQCISSVIPENCTAPLILPLVYVLWLVPLLLCTLLPSPGNCDDKNSPN